MVSVEAVGASVGGRPVESSLGPGAAPWAAGLRSQKRTSSTSLSSFRSLSSGFSVTGSVTDWPAIEARAPGSAGFGAVFARFGAFLLSGAFFGFGAAGFFPFWGFVGFCA
jgi:hypothetical protein